MRHPRLLLLRSVLLLIMAPLWYLANLRPHELLKFVGHFGVRRTFAVVLPTILVDEHGIFDEVLGVGILVHVELGFHGGKVHWFLDDIVVVLYLVLVDWGQKRPGALVVLHCVEKMQELIVVGATTRLARQLVHLRRPA